MLGELPLVFVVSSIVVADFEFSSSSFYSDLYDSCYSIFYWSSSIMSIPSINLEASTTLAFDIYSSLLCQSLI